jgi:hypothetical protein
MHTKNIQIRDGVHLYSHDDPQAIRGVGIALGSALELISGHPDVLPTAEAIANARLWAASPQLLEQAIIAANGMLDVSEILMGMGHKAIAERMYMQYAALNAAIAVAIRGKS